MGVLSLWLCCSTTKSNPCTLTALDDAIEKILKLCCCSTKKISPWKTQKSDFPTSIRLFLLLCDELYRYQKNNTGYYTREDRCACRARFHFYLHSAVETLKSLTWNLLKAQILQVSRLCRGNPSCSVFPQRRTGNQHVLTLLSAGANYKAGGEVGGESTAWFLVSSATACWSPCWGLPLASNLPPISSSFHLSFI